MDESKGIEIVPEARKLEINFFETSPFLETDALSR